MGICAAACKEGAEGGGDEGRRLRWSGWPTDFCGWLGRRTIRLDAANEVPEELRASAGAAGREPCREPLALRGWERECDHEVSILMVTGAVGRWRGIWPRAKNSMMVMRPPQQGQERPGAFGSSGWALVEALGQAALMASIGMSGAASSSRIRAMFLARVGVVRKP
jgi:hypothetical protein